MSIIIQSPLRKPFRIDSRSSDLANVSLDLGNDSLAHVETAVEIRYHGMCPW
jgi:hypothetical protein